MSSAIIVGAGPAGLTAARTLRAGGIADVMVLERSAEPGGLPRSCGHPGWGMIDLHRLCTGPGYANRLVKAAAGANIVTGASVLRLLPEGGVEVALLDRGVETVRADMVLLATGIRETPRSARLVSGTRPAGVTTTGAFQDMVFRGGMRPFKRPIIVGSELVAFSALLTARHAGISPVAMIEPNARIVARRPCDLVAKWAFGVPVLTRARLKEILGLDTVEAVVVERDGRNETIACDGVIFTGKFVPDATLVRASHLAFDRATGGPAIDTAWRCSDPRFFAAGNVLRPVEHSGMAASEGLWAAGAMLRAATGGLREPQSAIPVEAAAPFSYVYPQRIFPRNGRATLRARVGEAVSGTLVVRSDARVLASSRLRALPERRVSVIVPTDTLDGSGGVRLTIE